MRRKTISILLGALMLFGLVGAVPASASVSLKWNSSCSLWFVISWEGIKNGERQTGSVNARTNSETTLPVKKVVGVWVLRNDAGERVDIPFDNCPQSSACSYYSDSLPARSQVLVNISKEGGIVISIDGNVLKTCH